MSEKKVVKHKFTCLKCGLLYHEGDRLLTVKENGQLIFKCTNCKNKIAVVLTNKGELETK